MIQRVLDIMWRLFLADRAGGIILDANTFLRRMDYARREYDAAGRKAGKQIGKMMEGEVKKELSKPGHGRTYYTVRSGSRAKFGYFTERGPSLPFGDSDYIVHTASAPGESPAPMWGFLRASINSEVVPYSNGSQVIIGTNKRYGLGGKYSAAIFEFGTSKMAPRPFLFKTILANWNKALVMWAGRFKKIKGTGRR